MRNRSMASLNVTVVANEREVLISAIGAWGSNGDFFNFSWEQKVTNRSRCEQSKKNWTII